jgi:hypothetical protein
MTRYYCTKKNECTALSKKIIYALVIIWPHMLDYCWKLKISNDKKIYSYTIRVLFIFNDTILNIYNSVENSRGTMGGLRVATALADQKY